MNLPSAPNQCYRDQGETKGRGSRLHAGRWESPVRSDLGGTNMNGPHTHPIMKISTEILTGSSHVHHAAVPDTTSLSQGYVLGAACGSGQGRGNPHSWGRWGAEMRSLSLPRSRLVGQPLVLSPQRPPPTKLHTLELVVIKRTN